MGRIYPYRSCNTCNYSTPWRYIIMKVGKVYLTALTINAIGIIKKKKRLWGCRGRPVRIVGCILVEMVILDLNIAWWVSLHSIRTGDIEIVKTGDENQHEVMKIALLWKDIMIKIKLPGIEVLLNRFEGILKHNRGLTFTSGVLPIYSYNSAQLLQLMPEWHWQWLVFR